METELTPETAPVYEQRPQVAAPPKVQNNGRKWRVWVLRPVAKQNPLIVDANNAGDAWKKFCKLNGVSEDTEGGRVIRLATDKELN